jgi:hypothetical protein
VRLAEELVLGGQERRVWCRHKVRPRSSSVLQDDAWSSYLGGLGLRSLQAAGPDRIRKGGLDRRLLLLLHAGHK